MIETIFSHSHVRGFLFDQQNEFGITLNIFNLVNVRRDGLATDTHACAIYRITVFNKTHASYHQSLVGRHNMQITSRTANHGGDIIQDAIRLGLIYKELDIRVEKVTLCNMNLLDQPVVIS
jgi:hypothetical protein